MFLGSFRRAIVAVLPVLNGAGHTSAVRLGPGSGPSIWGRLPVDDRDLTAIPRGCQPDRPGRARARAPTRWRGLILGRFDASNFLGIARDPARRRTRASPTADLADASASARGRRIGSAPEFTQSSAAGILSVDSRAPIYPPAMMESELVSGFPDEDRAHPRAEIVGAKRWGSEFFASCPSPVAIAQRDGREPQSWAPAFAPRSSWPWPG